MLIPFLPCRNDIFTIQHSSRQLFFPPFELNNGRDNSSTPGEGRAGNSGKTRLQQQSWFEDIIKQRNLLIEWGAETRYPPTVEARWWKPSRHQLHCAQSRTSWLDYLPTCSPRGLCGEVPLYFPFDDDVCQSRVRLRWRDVANKNLKPQTLRGWWLNNI